MPYGVVGWMVHVCASWMAVLISPRERAILGVDMGWPIIPMGNWHCCVRTCEAMKLLFGEVSGFGPKNGVLDGVQILGVVQPAAAAAVHCRH